MSTEILEKTELTLEQIKLNQKLSLYIDTSLQIPAPYLGSGEIKLVVIGQDPTVKNAQSRKDIKTVLNLNKNRSVTAYLSGICNNLGISLKKNVYATNLYKNFFIEPPTQIKAVDIFTEFLPHWLPLLLEELSMFDNLPVLTLGEPILAPLLNHNVTAKVKEYWGYTPYWKIGQVKAFRCIKAQDNKLSRWIFPFPHQPSIRKEFYKYKMVEYTLFMKQMVFK